ncbi:MAG: aminoglycoside phosphotransferase family protein [Candidatus Symbiodolus clandestinus]
MTRLEANILKLSPEHGRCWLQKLPEIVQAVARKYQLSLLKPLADSQLSFHYLLAGFQGNNPVILKLGLDVNSLRREGAALRQLAGHGAVQVLAEDIGMLLLERVTPGYSLKACPSKVAGLPIACQLMRLLHQAKLPQHSLFPSIESQLLILDKAWEFPLHYLQTARKLRDKLLHSIGSVVLLHGDLHTGNILQTGETWAAIDPKGFIGPPIHDTWAFVKDIEADTRFIADYFHWPLQAVRDCYFVQVVRAYCENLEDGLDNTLFDHLMEPAYALVSR